MKHGGYFVISLDFELMWGMFDKVTTDTYGKNILGGRQAISELLRVFEERGIHATWATVGMLMANNIEDLEQYVPSATERPKYPDQKLSSYEHLLDLVKNTFDKDYYFAPDLVNKINGTSGQELASHTFSHYYCLDGSENSDAIFAADCRSQIKIMKKFGVTPTSIVFPRNQNTEAALDICSKNGITCYRGTEEHFLYKARKEREQTNLFIRGLRLLDHYINISGHHTFALKKTDAIVNVPASRFLRPYSKKLKFLEAMRMQRIKNSMSHAARNNEVFHLWWHPHNFGVNRKENFKDLLELLDHYENLHQEFGMESRNMKELATLVAESSDVKNLAT